MTKEITVQRVTPEGEEISMEILKHFSPLCVLSFEVAKSWKFCKCLISDNQFGAEGGMKCVCLCICVCLCVCITKEIGKFPYQGFK